MIYYAGIGSRETPQFVLDKIIQIADNLSNKDYILRSGGADGADEYFFKGSNKKTQILLPWKGFNGLLPLEDKIICADVLEHTVKNKAFQLVEELHPAPHNLSIGARKLHMRNIMQVLGPDLIEPVEFVICWTKNGKIIGGTATAIRCATKFDIPVVNLGLLPISDEYDNLVNRLFKMKTGLYFDIL